MKIAQSQPVEPTGAALEEFKWHVAQLGMAPIQTFGFGWVFTFLVWDLVLSSVLGADAATIAILASEVTAGIFLVIVIQLSETKPFVTYTIERTLRATDLASFGSRASDVPSNVLSYLGKHVWDREAFLLGHLRESPAIPVDERPRTLKDVSRVIVLSLVEKASSDGHPWTSVAPYLNKLASAFDDPKTVGLLRDALSEGYVDAPPGYRRYVMSPQPSRLSRYIEAHPWLGPVASGVGIFLGNLIAVILLITRRG